jgi:hypothetical protein
MTTPPNNAPQCPTCGRHAEILPTGVLNWHWPWHGSEPCTASGKPYTPPPPPPAKP